LRLDPPIGLGTANAGELSVAAKSPDFPVNHRRVAADSPLRAFRRRGPCPTHQRNDHEPLTGVSGEMGAVATTPLLFSQSSDELEGVCGPHGILALAASREALPCSWNGEQDDADLRNQDLIQDVLCGKLRSAVVRRLSLPKLRSLSACVAFTTSLTILEYGGLGLHSSWLEVIGVVCLPASPIIGWADLQSTLWPV
jgi:hypothetical protein